jgi:uncharacterized protein (DUF488 family)
VLGRQKILLTLLASAEAPLTRTLLVKLAFLLREETEVGTDATFYAFVPYHYGPFSFVLYRELEALTQQSYILEQGERLSLADPMAGEVRRLAADLRPVVRASIQHIVSRYGSRRPSTLLRDVYARYPWYATKSQRDDLLPPELPPLPAARPLVYTVGYERASVDAFFDKLLQTGIQGIADIRANPISRKYGFARVSLEKIATHLGLTYHGFPQLGIPSRERAALGAYATYQELLDRYESKMLPLQAAKIAELSRIMERKPTALLCVEADVRCCHRSRLAKAVARETGLAIEHLS